MNKKKIIVLGFMGGCPIAGVIWQHLHYIIGLQRLGHEVFYVEDTSRFPYDPAAFTISDDYGYAVQTLATLAREHGFVEKWAYCARYCDPFEIVGMERSQLLELYKTCDVALNICGSHDLNEDLALIPHLLYVESDPGVEQIKIDLNNQDTLSFLSHHKHLFTFGEQIGTPAFVVPTHDFKWLPTRQPVMTDLWCNTPTAMPPATEALYTSICNWSTSGKKDILWHDSNYLWSKSLEFLKFVEAPKKCGEIFELATDIKKEEELALFANNDWRLILPHDLSTDWKSYHHYICSSKGEFTCAKDQYVRLHTGWFSDRSACYLAAGRPVITQETGFSNLYGNGVGLIGFSTMEEIVEAARSIRTDYKKHSQAALEIARDYFEAEKVLGSLLERAGV
ncbi:MAG: glycosyltransferase [Chthoniobacterales bacterium]